MKGISCNLSEIATAKLYVHFNLLVPYDSNHHNDTNYAY